MITIKNLTKQYAGTTILEQIHYTFPEKGIVCLMGPSGSGKTTLLNLLAGFDSQYEGELLVGSTPIHTMNAAELCTYRKDNIGFVFQNYHLLKGYTVLENVMLACELSNAPSEQTISKAQTILERIGLSEKVHEKIEHLSGGQKQRVAIARALMGNPQIILADEPTGALDRNTSNEIMEVLSEIAQEKLVIVITHDEKICAYANEVIHLKGKQIHSEQPADPNPVTTGKLILKPNVKHIFLSHSFKNFKVHFKRYLAISIAISIGLLAFLFSLSFGTVMDHSIADFQRKNTAYNSGFIKGCFDETLLHFLKKDKRIERVYYQYVLKNITLSAGERTETISEKFPDSKATKSMSYGRMPEFGKNEIALTPSLAKKFKEDIDQLIGETIQFTCNGATQTLTISGIFNENYDDFFLSSNVEQTLYKNMNRKQSYGISYEVKEFSDIVSVSKKLKSNQIQTKDAAVEAAALETTFHSLNQLFFMISVFLLLAGFFLCTILLIKLQNSRYHEVGLLSSLGYSKGGIFSILMVENIVLSFLSAFVSLSFLACSSCCCKFFSLDFSISVLQLMGTVVAAFLSILAISTVASSPLLHIEPAKALRK
ncbi:MAG: ABC transporter ATP-binding protein/permease [Lachnospiraceae bacterium]